MNENKDLSITIAENGFVVHESDNRAFVGKTWVFETAESLGKFALEWGSEKTKQRKAPQKQS